MKKGSKVKIIASHGTPKQIFNAAACFAIFVMNENMDRTFFYDDQCGGLHSLLPG